MTREEWLKELIDLLRNDFRDIGYPIPQGIKASCGFPSKSALSASSKRIGECWARDVSVRDDFEIFISPVIDNTGEVGATLVHELVHTLQEGHRGIFPKVAKAIGLEGKMTATYASSKLKERLHALTSQIGPYPHKKLTPDVKEKKQSTRMLKVECGDCGCIVRMTQKWLDEAGFPSCGCGTVMKE